MGCKIESKDLDAVDRCDRVEGGSKEVKGGKGGSENGPKRYLQGVQKKV